MADRVGRQINKASSVNKTTIRKIELMTEERKVLNRGHFLIALANAVRSCYNKMTSALNIDELFMYLCGISPYEETEHRAVFLRHNRHRSDGSGLVQVLIQVRSELRHFH